MNTRDHKRRRSIKVARKMYVQKYSNKSVAKKLIRFNQFCELFRLAELKKIEQKI